MPRGETTTIKETKAEKEVHKIVKRNATTDDLKRAKQQYIGSTFVIDSKDVYRVIDAYVDNIGRLIVIGQLEGL